MRRSQSPGLTLDTTVRQLEKRFVFSVSYYFTAKANVVEEQAKKLTRTVKLGETGAEYVLEQFHFHQGKSSTKGSEHTVDGKS